METIKIQLSHSTNQCLEEISAEFQDDEIAILRDYLSNTKKLLEAKMIQESMPCHVNFTFEVGQGSSIEAVLPDEDSILSFLHRMRKFILNDEYSSYNKVTGIIARRFNNHPRVLDLLKKQSKIYKGKYFQELIQITSNGTLINSDKVLFDWLNAFEYHTDQTKKAEIEKLHQLMPLDASRVVFLTLLTEKMKAIDNVASFISVLLGEADTTALNT